MNDNTPDTVQELVDMQEAPECTPEQKKHDKKVRKLMDKMIAAGPEVGLDVMKVSMEKMIRFHKAVLQQALEDGKPQEEMAFWVYDIARLETAAEILDTIKL